MKRNVIFFGAVFTTLLMISSVTALEQVNNEHVIEAIEDELLDEAIDAENPLDDIINQLLVIWDDLVSNNPIVAWFQDTYDINAEEDFEQLFDHQGLINHMISDDFINMLNSNLDEILAIEAFQIIYNTEPMQEYIQSDEFLDFIQTDEMQYFLSQIDGEYTEASQTYESYAQQNQELLEALVGLYGVSSNEPQNIGMLNNGQIENDGASFQTIVEDETQPAMGNPVFAFIGLLVGLITWVPAAVIIMLCAPIVWIALTLEWATSIVWTPGAFIFTAVVTFVLTFTFAIILALVWPVFIATLFGGYGFVMAL